MQSKNYKILLTIILCITVFCGNAQISQTLTVEELFQLGIENSLKIKASRINLDIAQEKEKQAKISRLPNIGIEISESYNGQPIIFQDGLGNPLYPYMPDWSQSYQIGVNQPIYQGGKIKNNIEKKALEKQISSLNIDKDKADIKLLLINKYLDLFRLYKQKEVFIKNIEDAQTRLHDVQQMEKQGMITENDVIRNELLLTNYELSLRETNDDITILSQQLDIALGLEESIILVPDTNMLNENPPILSYDDYIQQSYSQYPDIQIVKSGIEVAQKDLSIAKGNYLPTLSLFAGNALKRPILSSSPVKDLFMNSWNLGLTLSYNLSSVYQNKSNMNIAKQAIFLQQTYEDQLKQNLRANVKAYYIKHMEAIDRIDALSKSVKQAEENFRIVQNKYYNQLAVLTDVLDATSVRLTAELQFTAAKANAVYAYYQLLWASGNL